MLDRTRLTARAVARLKLEVRDRRAEQGREGWYDDEGVRQGGLIAFVRHFWDILEPEAIFVDGWPLWAMCEHLEAVTFGRVTRLMINVPPGFMKSLLVDVFWPAWEWGAIGRSHLRYVTFSYSASLTERDNGRFRDLITSEKYQALYGQRVEVRNKTTIKVINTRTGWKLASSVGGVGTGERGDRVILDDPHNVKEAESQIVRDETVRWFRESMSNRLNDENGVIVLIMQRVHEDDVSGVILDLGLDYVHLMIPMEFEYGRNLDERGRPVPTRIGWLDPREEDGVLAFPERFGAAWCGRMRHEVGPYAWAGQYQQSPAPRGGGIFQREWWQVWEPKTWPEFEFVLASVDGAFTEKEENCPSAMTVWGVYLNEKRQKRLLLIRAWRKHLKFSCPPVERLREMVVIGDQKYFPDFIEVGMSPAEVKMREERYYWRAQKEWGLLEWIRHTCLRMKVDICLIEGKGPGLSAAEQLQSRYGKEGWAVQVEQVKGDKVARALAAQATFSQLGVFAPHTDWAQMVIDEMAVFPKGKTDDLTDSATQAINYLRRMGLAPSDEEMAYEEAQRREYKGKLTPIYPV
jgi:predicted phage terminase large subunit-like protein